MKVALEKSFPMPGSPDAAWAVLKDVEAVAGCMPGAKLTEHADETHYKGTVAVKVGPASMSFRGTIEVVELDAARRLLHLVGKGADSSGTSGATMDLTARIEPGADSSSSVLIGNSEISLNGKAAAFGGRMMNTVAEQVLKDFAANFADDVQAKAADQAPAGAEEAAAGPPAAASSAAATAGPPPATAAASVATGQAPQQATATVVNLSAVPPPASAARPARRRRRELSAFGLLWAIVRDAVLGIFRRGPRSGQPRVP